MLYSIYLIRNMLQTTYDATLHRPDMPIRHLMEIPQPVARALITDCALRPVAGVKDAYRGLINQADLDRYSLEGE